MSAGESLERLAELMARLRGPEGCPWDREQTLDSLRPFIVEEAYELVEAIERSDMAAIREELGDLMLEILFVSQIGSEAGAFTLREVLDSLVDKIVRRHPHVFGTERARSAGEALARWESVKAEEKAERAKSLLADIPRSFPALLRALKISRRVADVGFDWQSAEEVFEKLEEELQELQAARASGDRDAMEDEIGDILFVMVNLARHLGVDPELALHAANRKFASRFRHVEERLAAAQRSLADSTLEEMESLWKEAKKREP